MMSLPAELRLNIFRYCCCYRPQESLLSLSMCCKQLHEDVKPLLWRNMRVQWKHLKVPMAPQLQCMKFSTRLELTGIEPQDLQDLHDDAVQSNFVALVESCSAVLLKELNVSYFLPETGMKVVGETLHNIQSLYIMSVTSSLDWSYISLLRELKELRLSGCGVQDVHFRDFGLLKNLHGLELIGCDKVTGIMFTMFESSSLSTIEFSRSSTLGVNYEVSSWHFCNLKMLDLDGLFPPRFFFNVNESFKKLHELWLDNSLVDDQGLFYISKIITLEKLIMEQCYEITDDGLIHVSNMKSLKILSVCTCDSVTDDGIYNISSMESLQTLDLSRSDWLTDLSLAHLSTCPGLTSLTIECCNNFTDAGLQYVGEMKSLESLSIEYGFFTDEGLKHLSGLKLKEFGYYENSGITHEGVEQAGLPCPEHVTAHVVCTPNAPPSP